TVSVQDDAAVVHRVMEGAPREDERVDDGGDDADLGPGGDGPPCASGARAVQVQGVPDPSMDRGQRPRSALAICPGDVADQGLIEDRFDRAAVVRGSFGESVDSGALGGSLGHPGMLPGVAAVVMPEAVPQEVPVSIVEVIDVVPVLDGLVDAPGTVLTIGLVLIRPLLQT